MTPREPHDYISTACLHGRHEQCGVAQLGRGDLSAPHCKYCSAVCACPTCNHAQQATDEARLTHTMTTLRHVQRPGSGPPAARPRVG